MRSVNSLAAMFAVCLAAAFLSVAASGCKPAAPSRSRASSTDSATTDGAAPDITIPDGEVKDEKPADEKKADEKKADEKKSEEKKEEEKTPADKDLQKADDDKAKEDKKSEKPAEEKKEDAKPAAGDAAALQNPVIKPGAWNQWGGTSLRNNTPIGEGIPTEWAPGEFDRKTGAWAPETAKNIKWASLLGSQTYGNTVVAAGKVWLGTNNSGGYLKRYPGETVDLGCLLCFDEKDGKFLWQHSSEKLPTGRVHDWPLQGICCSPLVEGNRLWFVTSRGEVRCLDVEGFYDGEDDGRPEKEEPARLFDVVRADDPALDKVGGYQADLDKGKLPADLRPRFAAAGMPLPDGEVAVKVDDKAKGAAKRWTFQAKVNGKDRDFTMVLAGPRLSVFKIITPDDKEEADVIWAYDMMKELGISQHNMCSCSVTSFGDILFVNTSNGVDESHSVIPAPEAPSFMAMDKNTGKVFWTDNSPGRNVLHGQWSSPTVAVIGGVPQVIFGGGDAWVYSFKADKGKDGKPELLWKFDINPKDSILELGGRGTRNDIISTPVVYDDKVYFCTGQDPEHGEGVGILWCIDPTKRGDISEKLAVNRADPKKPIPVKRVQAVVEADGDMAIDNPNSGVVWKYMNHDADGNKKLDFEEQFHRSISTVAIKNDLLFVPDFSGLFHCVDAKTGKTLWNYDMLAAAWGSAMIVGDKVYIGDEDGDIAVFNLTKEKHDPIAEINMGNSVYSTPIVANNVLYIANKDHVFAIAEGAKPAVAKATGGE
jgi:outer membrane protein assembly factor BamB